MFPIESFRVTIDKVVTIFRKHEIPFHLTGGSTVIAHSEPRFTQDIDIVVQNAAVSKCLVGLLDSLDESKFIFDRSAISKAVASKDMFQLFDSVEALKVDIYPRELVPGELSRSVVKEVFDGVELPIASRGDAVLSKLIWISKGSGKSRQDLRKIHRRCSETELQFINEMTEQFKLTELLKTVLAEPDEIE